MRRRYLRSVRLSAIGVPLATLMCIAPAHPAVAMTRTITSAPAFAVRGGLFAVAATSARNAWAVGQTGSLVGASPKTLIVRWNGKAWRRVTSPSPTGGALLNGVAATSARNAWAVGQTGGVGSPQRKSLILHWDGTAWARVPSPTPAGGGVLFAVAAASARNAWAVGYAGRGQKTLILHWDGTAWTRVPSPTPAGGAILDQVAFTSRSNGWAVGSIAYSSKRPRSFVLHWDGSAWTRVASPTPAGGAILDDVFAASARSGWAVGQTGSVFTRRPATFILHWDGSAWTRVPSPTPAGGAILYAVADTSGRSAWAVGQTGSFSSLKPTTFVLHWNGASWN
jgi:hypothetical protein